MKSWAEKEIELACKKENPDWDGESFDYGIFCYKSALKAFNALLKDNHSGMSIGFTKNILNRLIDGKPLTNLEDVEDEWNLAYEEDGIVSYQNRRYSSLFKDVDSNGNVKFYDNQRVLFYEVGFDSPFHYGKANRFVEELFPITMPYYPTKPYKVYGELVLSDEELRKHTDWDYEAFYYILTPEGERVELNKFFKVFDTCPEKDIDTEITKEEFEKAKTKNNSDEA